MNTRETPEALIVETPGQARQPCSFCGATPSQACRGFQHVRTWPAPAYVLPPRIPPPNLQRFELGGRGPCRFCGEAAALDKVTGLCCACCRVWVLGRP